MAPRLQQHYYENIQKQLGEELGIKNVFETGVRYLSFDSIVTIAACFIISFLALCFNDA